MYFLSIRFISFFISTLDFGFNENGKSEFSKIFIQPNFFFLNVIGIKSDISNSFSFLRRSIANSRVFFYSYAFFKIFVICFIISSIRKSFGVNTALTPKDKSFFSSLGGIIPPTTTGIM